MNVAEFRKSLETSPESALRFVLPTGQLVPVNAHITEVGRTDRRFIDCGGTIRKVQACTLQAWVADDTDHRLLPGSLAAILEKASPVLESENLEVELEFEAGFLSQFPVTSVTTSGDTLSFQLGTKHTDCLAKELCTPKGAANEEESCCNGGGCC